MRSSIPTTTLPNLLFVLMLGAALLSGCSGTPKVDYVDAGNSYESADLASILGDADLAQFEDIATEDATDVRKESLVDLRTRGEDASELADLLTRGFPQTSSAVPASVELATFDGNPSWIVVEAWGDEGETLAHRRIWVFERESGALIASASQR